MARTKTYYYLIDKLNNSNAGTFKKVLQTVDSIKSITIRPNESMVELISTRNPEDSVKIACDIAGTKFRVRVKNR
jgi:PDZ domain-containing secreted protein